MKLAEMSPNRIEKIASTIRMKGLDADVLIGRAESAFPNIIRVYQKGNHFLGKEVDMVSLMARKRGLDYIVVLRNTGTENIERICLEIF